MMRIERLPAATTAASVDRGKRAKIKSRSWEEERMTRQDKSSSTAAGVAPNRNKKILTLHPNRFHPGMS
jgi:hypothetical protein